MGKATRDYIYGINPAFEVVRGGKRKVYQAFINQAAARQPRLKKLIQFLETRNIPLEMTDKGRLSDLSRHKEHQGVVLKTGVYPYADFDDLLGRPKLLLLDNVEDPHNVGAILRSAEIFGFHGVLLSSRGVPDVYPSVVKVSAGASEFLEIAKDRSANAYVKEAQAHGYQIAALDGGGKTTLAELAEKRVEKLLLVIGGEDHSVGQYILNSAEYVVRIPQQGKINSLNASVAASIALYALSGNNLV